jgi:hypothetical protein
MDSLKIVFLFLVLVSFSGRAQISPSLGKAILESRSKQDLTFIGLQFLGKPYRSNSLSPGNPEILVADLASFDCVTFIENTLALAHSKGNNSNYRTALRQYRYAGDSVQYEKRYHYFSDAMWQLGFPLLGTSNLLQKSHKTFSFLSTYLYKKKSGQIDLELLRVRENKLAQRPFYFTPNSSIEQLLPILKSGDLIGLVSNNPSIDFLHTGMVYRKDGKVYLLHASQEFKRVMVSKETLIEYVKTHRQFIGICAFRPIFKE